ncbi:Enamine deaminase RidA, house cleaning of reactive enamine intermediates, YjgF/YER057c/UK114 family [Microbulbifer donghaiensis]|uniref:Enamine deaminase RidA, house cleaning of reactive enamine intermediates, YjgF/YER057c/UK114 family n=1 Tax=Microbulbifer donghaiensis TaxID=494016 RepID=A0A1M5DVT0_9GAMM|nr:RidA family protein [Microbulbifer donghaiensis]SHF71148.1 Enamine deaminase RidA, house cleaning of reactive enamine intermediates, YjgF/YER057c/UK114 family [Microbulbifer donghaiensis]
MSIQNVNPADLYDGTSSGMSHAKVDTEVGLVFVSGQVDWDTNYEVKNSNIEAQTEGAAKNLLSVLEAANSSAENILQLRVYVRGEVADHMEKIVPIIAGYLGTSRPALTGIGVASLATPDTLIEIEAVAKVSK